MRKKFERHKLFSTTYKLTDQVEFDKLTSYDFQELPEVTKYKHGTTPLFLLRVALLSCV